MHSKFVLYICAVLLTCGMAAGGPILAEDALSKTNSAVANILFEYDADEFASFGVRDDGFLDITFARNIPDELFSEILTKLQKHPDIKGVLAGKGGPSCPRF